MPRCCLWRQREGPWALASRQLLEIGKGILLNISSKEHSPADLSLAQGELFWNCNFPKRKIMHLDKFSLTFSLVINVYIRHQKHDPLKKKNEWYPYPHPHPHRWMRDKPCCFKPFRLGVTCYHSVRITLSLLTGKSQKNRPSVCPMQIRDQSSSR